LTWKMMACLHPCVPTSYGVRSNLWSRDIAGWWCHLCGGFRNWGDPIQAKLTKWMETQSLWPCDPPHANQLVRRQYFRECISQP
jgi:hypothetical protein